MAHGETAAAAGRVHRQERRWAGGAVTQAARGNFEGYLGAGSKQKWLEVHGDTHFTHFYSKYGEALQKRFFGYFLKGEDTDWNNQPRVLLNIRHPGEKFVLREENEWPLARTQWTKYFFGPEAMLLAPEPSAPEKELDIRGGRRS